MDEIGTILNAVVIGVVGLLLAWHTKGRFDALEKRMDRLEDGHQSLRSDLTRLEENNQRAHEVLRSDLTRLGEMNERTHSEIRGDITQVALFLRTPPRAENA